MIVINKSLLIIIESCHIKSGGENSNEVFAKWFLVTERHTSRAFNFISSHVRLILVASLKRFVGVTISVPSMNF